MSFATTMLRPTPRTTRSAARLLAEPSHSRGSILSNPRSLHQHSLILPSLFPQNSISTASTSGSTPRFAIRGSVGRLQARPFTSTGKNPARHLQSDVRHREAAAGRPLVGVVHGGLSRMVKKANRPLDSFVATIVSVGASESYMYRLQVLNKSEIGQTPTQFSSLELYIWNGTNGRFSSRYVSQATFQECGR